MDLALVGIALGIVHFSIPIGYYAYLRRFRRFLAATILDEDYKPQVSIVVPTYNEARLITEKLNNLARQRYPISCINLLLIDSASSDGTVGIAENWREANPSIRFDIVSEPTRKGKAVALNNALQRVSQEIVIFTDADSSWAPDALSRGVRYFSDLRVGAVTAVKTPQSQFRSVESEYRHLYNMIRVLESNLHSTPVFNGEFAAFRKSILMKIGGFSLRIGADDSHMATLVALENHRAIAAPDVRVSEVVPENFTQLKAWRVRRAKHLIQHFVRALPMIVRASPGFREILAMEIFLNLINPWLLLLASIFISASVILGGPVLLPFAAMTFLVPIMLVGKTRHVFLAWTVNQFVLCYAMLAGVRSTELVWKKVERRQL